ncbi:WD repeat-containing and planar cell polarity effector protein fritz homolog [Clytia hemisphaerica]|uniref:WD repeat-containing and planar cell polarity effector protein fritz n=1 Tax=Clytia hemisphaerica TaxID=252671 RepID=A0A7M5XJK6_9CNID
MTELLGLFNVWSTRKYLQPHVTQHPGVNIYHEKNSNVLDSDQYIDIKKKYVEGQGRPWSLSNRRTEKFRDTLNEFEELLESQFVAGIAWRNTRTVQLLLSNAVIITITIAIDSADIEKIFIDKTLVGKLPDFISDGVIEESFMVLSFVEKSKLTIVNFSKKVTSEKKDIEKLSSYEPKVSIVDLPGPSSRRIKRNCLCNTKSDLVCVWWSNTIEEAWPWSPLVSEADRANLVLLSITNISSVFSVDVIAYMRTDGDPIDVCFSHSQPYQILTLEQSQSSRAKYLLEVCIYELYGEKITKVAAMTIPLKARVVCQCRNYKQDKIALTCGNQSLILWDEYQRKAKTSKTNFIASTIEWHSGDTIFVVASVNGDIQVFDMALNCFYVQLSCDDSNPTTTLKLSQLFFSNPKLKRISWAVDNGVGAPPDAIPCSDDLLLVFERGPISVLRFEFGVCTQGMVTPIELTCEYIKNEQITEAISLLCSMNWNQMGSVCFQCLTLITDHLLRQRFNQQCETGVEDTLGSFYAPVRPLQESTILQYRDDISRIARRFFHQLLRHKRFEKAFLLAVDIGAKDLFMDIHYLAQSVGNMDVATASKDRAMQIHYRENNGGADLGPLADDLNFVNELPQHRQQPSVTSQQSEEIDQGVRRISLNDHPPNMSPLRPPRPRNGHQQQQPQQPVRYSFAESDDDSGEKEEDPIAWALASRAGQVNVEDKKEEKDDLHLVHFGNV